MAALSKLLTCSCYELGHTWEPSCSKAVAEVARHGYGQAFKIYLPLYLITAVLKKRKKSYYLRRLMPEVLRSTFFLGTNAFSFIAFFCLWRRMVGYYMLHHMHVCGIPTLAILSLLEPLERRIVGYYDWWHVTSCTIPSLAIVSLVEIRERKLMGRFTFLTAAFVPSLGASFCAVVTERQHRRTMLAVYMLNVVLLFCVVSSLYMYLFKTRNGLSDSTLGAFKFLLGDSEMAPPLLPEGSPSTKPSQVHNNNPESPSEAGDATALSSLRDTKPSYRSSQSNNSILKYLPREIQVLVHQFRNGRKHHLCRHRNSCVSEIVESFLRMFGIGYAIQAVLKLLRALTMILRNPKAMLDALKHSENVKLGAFLGSFSAIFKLVNCVLRWIRNKESNAHGLVSGFLAGTSMMFWKSTTVAMYMASKLAELFYLKGIDNGLLPYIKYGEILIYTISTSIVFHAAVFEPHSLRPAYWKFLLQVTNGRFAEMNRQLLDIYGTNASKLMPDFWPDYDPRYSSLTLDSVKEMILQASK